MRLLTIALLLAIAYSSANGFMFKKKYKNGCDPNPCKHKGVCSLSNPRNNKKDYHCECPVEYHGENCEKKSGCRKNMFGKMPCGKHGTCSNDAANPSKYHCACEHGYVGEDCDIKDKCLSKNPCKKDSVCTLNKKFKPVCECKIGFMGSKCDKRNCTITELKAKYMSGKGRNKIYIDQSLKAKFSKMDSLAKLCGVEISVSQSFTKLVHPTDMPKNNDAPFFIGHGLRFEVMDKKGKKVICDKKCLGKTPIGDKSAACFINGLDAIGFKYSSYLAGVVHDGYHVANFGNYNRLKQEKQIGCQQDKHFPVVTGKDHLVVDYNTNSADHCPKGLAGEKCDKDDLCVKKNPCAKGNQCTLDKNLKPVCECKNGYKGKKCNDKNCTIVAWKGKRFGGGFFSRTKVYISQDLEGKFKKLDDLAKLCKVNFKLNSSFKKNNDPKYKIDMQAPAYAGYGIDVELLDNKNKLLCNKLCLSKKQTLAPAKCLLNGLEAIGFKHNAKFPGIIYEGSILDMTTTKYAKVKELKQVGCSSEKWFKKL